jgi:hypothetical protein
MTAPVITAIPTPPVRSDAPADFALKADAFAAALPQFVTQTNSSAAFVDQRAIDADASATAAAASEAAVEADRAEVAANTSTVAANTSTVEASAAEVAAHAALAGERAAAAATSASESAASAQIAVNAAASIADGPVTSVNGQTGVVSLTPASIGVQTVYLSGPTSAYVTQTKTYTITNFDSFGTYVAQVSAGSVSMSGETITLAAPSAAQTVTLTVTRDGQPQAFAVEILPDRPAAPIITSPEATGVMGNPTLSTGPFAMIGQNTDTHAATDWEIWTGAGRTGTLVWSSLNNSASKLSITLPENTLTVATDYHMAVRHIGTTFGAGEWAELAFRTADQFLPTVIGQAFGGGFYAGKIRYADGDYIIIVAPKSAETSLSHKAANSATAGTSSYHDGLANSNSMNNATHPAAQYCRAYNGGGFTDWHLPARDQLELLYRNLKPDTTANITGSRAEAGNHGDNANSVPVGASYTTGSPAQTSAAAFKTGGAEAFTVPTYYWSSTEYAPDTSSAWIQRFSGGNQSFNGKTNAYLVRPVRRLKI